MVEYYLSGHSYRETARIFGTSKNTVLKWVKRYKESGLEGLKDGVGQDEEGGRGEYNCIMRKTYIKSGRHREILYWSIDYQ